MCGITSILCLETLLDDVPHGCINLGACERADVRELLAMPVSPCNSVGIEHATTAQALCSEWIGRANANLSMVKLEFEFILIICNNLGNKYDHALQH